MDPTGARDDDSNRGFADEYDTCLISAASQLRRGAPAAHVIDFLVRVETDHMALGPGPTTRQRAEAVVAAILADGTIWTWPDAAGRFDRGEEP